MVPMVMNASKVAVTVTAVVGGETIIVQDAPRPHDGVTAVVAERTGRVETVPFPAIANLAAINAVAHARPSASAATETTRTGAGARARTAEPPRTAETGSTCLAALGPMFPMSRFSFSRRSRATLWPGCKVPSITRA